MEFERAIFRVYERCMDGLREDNPESISPKSCHIMESCVLTVGFALLAILALLHHTFVGTAGCLPHILEQIPNPYNARELSFMNDSMREIYLTSNLTALQLRTDQVLQINVLGSFVPPQTINQNSGDVYMLHEALDTFKSYMQPYSNSANSYLRGNYALQGLRQLTNNSESASSDHSITKHRNTNYQYEFAYNIGVLALPAEMRDQHDFKTFNITIQGCDCFGSSLVTSLIPLGGVDTIIKNLLINSFQHDGTLLTTYGDYYSWSMSDIAVNKSMFTVAENLGFKISVLLLSVVSFFFVSTVTALLVRILISSGVVLLFPFFYLVQRMGVGVLSWRLISLSYPWIGIPVEILRSRNISAVPFIMSHILRIFVYYFLYEAAQYAFSSWFYGDVRPGQRELWLFAIMMVLEYYSMIYLRSRLSIQFFPRFCLFCYVLFHVYLYCQPAGFHLLAMLVMFVFLVWSMIFCIRKFELVAYSRGQVSPDQPRVLHNSVPWPVWNVAMAPDFTLFWPLDNESTSIYDAPTDTSQPSTDGGNANDDQGPRRQADQNEDNVSDDSVDPELGNNSENRLLGEGQPGGYISLTTFNNASRRHPHTQRSFHIEDENDDDIVQTVIPSNNTATSLSSPKVTFARSTDTYSVISETNNADLITSTQRSISIM